VEVMMAEKAKLPMCFVAMPTGRTPEEALAYRGWLKEVYEPILSAKYRIELAVTNPQPVPIGEQILRHLVEAEMALFDLGGFSASDVANPNVMYELGIRHAFHRPAIVYTVAENLPFDLKPGRAVIHSRTLASAAAVREELGRQLQAAEDSHFWRPMEAVARAEVLRERVAGEPTLKLIMERLDALQQSVDRTSEAALLQRRRDSVLEDASQLGPMTLAVRKFLNEQSSNFRRATLGDLDDEDNRPDESDGAKK
jgi:hypothetical protein